MTYQWMMKMDFVSTYCHGHERQAPNTNVKLVFFLRTMSIFWKIIQITYLQIRCVISQVQNQSKLQYINHILDALCIPINHIEFHEYNFSKQKQL